MPKRTVTLTRGQITLAFVAVTIAFVAQGVILSNTIDNVNKSRRESCERTYQSFHDVLDNFLPPKGKRTPVQKDQIRDFNASIQRLKERCGTQTATKGAL